MRRRREARTLRTPRDIWQVDTNRGMGFGQRLELRRPDLVVAPRAVHQHDYLAPPVALRDVLRAGVESSFSVDHYVRHVASSNRDAAAVDR